MAWGYYAVGSVTNLSPTKRYTRIFFTADYLPCESKHNTAAMYRLVAVILRGVWPRRRRKLLIRHLLWLLSSILLDIISYEVLVERKNPSGAKTCCHVLRSKSRFLSTPSSLRQKRTRIIHFVPDVM